MSDKRYTDEPFYEDLSKAKELLRRNRDAQGLDGKPKDIMDMGEATPNAAAQPAQKTVMQTTQAKRTYSTNSVKTHAMQRGAAAQTVTDGPQVAQSLAGAQAQTKEKIAQFKADWKDAKRQALTQFCESAQNLDIDPKAAANQMIGQDAPGKAAALGFIAAEMMIGGGTMATMGKAIFVGSEISKSQKKLSPKQQEALLEDMVRGLERQSNNANSIVGGPRIDINWRQMGCNGLKALLAAHPDGEDQPEMQDLRNQEHALAEVEDHNLATARHYLDKDDENKHLLPVLKPKFVCN